MALKCSQELNRLLISFVVRRRSFSSIGNSIPKEGDRTILRAYRILQVSENSSNTEIRDAFMRLAKKHHPDSADSPDDEKFKTIEHAYRSITESRKYTNPVEEIEENVEPEIFSHKSPQHRQYLSNEGFGYGTPSQRQRQYQSYRLNRANDNAFNYRIGKISQYTEDALITLDREATKKFKTQNAIERVVEDLIQESMAKGEFQKLTGMGKPLNYSDSNPYVDSTTHKLNRILINNGFVPEWAVLGKDIETLKNSLSNKLAIERAKYCETPSDHDMTCWSKFLTQQNLSIEEINEKIHKFNFLCPTIQQQLCPVRIDIFGRKVFNGNAWREHVPVKELNSVVEKDPAGRKSRLSMWSFWNLLKSGTSL